MRILNHCKIKNNSDTLFFLLSVAVTILCVPVSLAQNVNAPEIPKKESIEIQQNIKSFNVRAANAQQLFSDNTSIKLWGVEEIKTDNTIFNLKSRVALEHKIGNNPITCTIKPFAG